MQVILRNDIAGLGKRGDIVDVADGHARNFLLPHGHAMKATAGASDREAATTVATTLVPKVITISAKAHDDKLFGSIHDAEIVAAVHAQTGIEIDRRAITIDEPIRTLGQHRVTATLHADVSFPITLEVVADA